MHWRNTERLVSLMVGLVLMAGLGCDTVPVNGGNGNGNGNGGSGTTLTIVKTSITVRHDAGLKAGNDLIAFGTGTTAGVSYIVPSATPTSGTAVTNSNLYNSSGFAVGGGTIFLAGSNTGSLAFQVSVYDVATAAITRTFDSTDIDLSRIPVSQDDTGNIQADGNYCVVICDSTAVTDGKTLKVIDVSGASPSLVVFTQNPPGSSLQVEQVAVDGDTKKVIAVVSDSFYVYDITTPTAAPTQIAVPNGIGDVQIQTDGGYILAVDDQATEEAFLVNLSTESLVSLTNAQAATSDLDIGGTTFAFFANADASDSIGGHMRAAVGTVPGPGFTKAALGSSIDGSTNNNGTVGFASSTCVTPDGSLVFLSGWYLQYSAAGATFTVPTDAGGTDPYATPAWDVDCSSNTVGFKTATDRSDTQDTTVGYIILP
jgi:hypothetical protein